MSRHEALLEVRLRACREMGVTRGGRAAELPARHRGVPARGRDQLHVDRERFDARRRREDARRARGHPARDGRRRGGAAGGAGRAARTASRARSCARSCGRRSSRTPRSASSTSRAARRPRPGTARAPGRSSAGEPVIVDLAPAGPRDRHASPTSRARSWSASRTRRSPRWHALVVEVARGRDRPRRGRACEGRELYARACDRFEAEGFATPAQAGRDGHGGLPDRARARRRPRDPRGAEPRPLRRGAPPGDVITIEPFLCRPGFGGVQVEEILLVTDDGRRAAERLHILALRIPARSSAVTSRGATASSRCCASAPSTSSGMSSSA